jgi:hypothetical protein
MTRSPEPCLVEWVYLAKMGLKLRSASQEIPLLFWNWNVHYCVHNVSSLVHTDPNCLELFNPQVNSNNPNE